MLKKAIALVVVVLVNGSIAHEFNDRSGETTNNEQRYHSDSISLGIDPPMHAYSSRNDYSYSSDSLSDSYSNSLQSPNDPAYSDPSPSNFEGSLNLTHTRTVRNANDKLADYLKHTTIVAHLVNGIAIQNGLMNGQIKAEELVGELLDFGSVSVSTIANFKKEKIVSLSEKLQVGKAKLDSTSQPYENLALEWNWLIGKSRIADKVNGLPGSADAFFKEVKKFETNYKLDNLTKPMSTLGSVHDELNALSTFGEKTETNYAYNKFGTLKIALDNVINTIDGLKYSVSVLSENYKTLKEGPNLLQPMEDMIDLIEKRAKFAVNFDEKGKKSVQDNLEVVLALVLGFQSAQQDVLNINDLVVHRSTSGVSQQKYTHGIPNRCADLKDLSKDARDPWIGQIINVKGSKLNGLADGLEPLVKLQQRMSGLDDKLKLIASKDVQVSMSYFKQLQDSLVTLKKDLVSVAPNLFDGFQKCYATQFPIPPITYKTTTNILTAVKRLKEFYIGANAAVDELDAKKLNETVQTLFVSLGFTQFDVKAQSYKEMPKVLKNIEKENGLRDINEFVEQLRAKFNFVSENLSSQIKDVAENSAKLKFIGIDKELELHVCAQKLEKTSNDVSLAIQAIQNLRALDSRKIEMLGTAATVVSEVAKGLSDVTSIPEFMKKEAKEAATEINKLPDSLKNSEAIGQSVTSLSSASLLKSLESKIGQLKTVDAAIRAETQKMSSPADRNKVESEWGEHKKDMDELEKTLAEIKTFDTGLDVSKASTLGAYGTPLKQLATLTSVNINAKEKLKALETLLSQSTIDPNTKSAIEESKKTLEQLSNLDLGFASHTAQYQSAPAAFQALHDFLSKFLAVDRTITVVKEESGDWRIWAQAVAGILLVALLLAFVAYKIYMFIKRRREYRELCGEIDTWMKTKDNLDNLVAAFDHHKSILVIMKSLAIVDQKKALEYLPKEKQRYHDTFCNPETAVKFSLDGKPVPIHANYVKSEKENCVEFVATQAPTNKGIPSGKVDTCEDFWAMVRWLKSEFIVNLCNKHEIGGKCGVYYHSDEGQSVTIGRFVITTKSAVKILEDTIMKRMLKVVDKKKKFGTKVITQYQYIEWPDHSIPDGHKTAVELMKLVNKSKKPVVVHCSAGIGRTISFIGLQYVYEEIINHPNISIMEAMRKMRGQRWHGIQTVIQSFWVSLGVLYRFTVEFNLDMTKYNKQMKLTELMKLYSKAYETNPNVIVIDGKPPAKEKKAPAGSSGAPAVEAPAESPGAPAAEAPAEAPRAPAAGDDVIDTEEEESSNEENEQEEEQRVDEPRESVAINMGNN